MSSILKALRRLEEERARKSPVAPEIAASLLRRGPQRRSTPRWLWPAIFSMVGLLLAASLWFWRPVSPAPQNVAFTPSVALPSVASTAGQGGELIMEEVIDQRRPVSLPPSTPAVAVTAPLRVKGNLPVATVAKESLSPAPLSRASFIEERQSPVVSAIAWQDDRAARMAVVDGLPVMAGELVGNAKVQEILQDRLIFSEGESLFTVYIDSQ
jgi:general secretion pathway protein B